MMISFDIPDDPKIAREIAWVIRGLNDALGADLTFLKRNTKEYKATLSTYEYLGSLANAIEEQYGDKFSLKEI